MNKTLEREINGIEHLDEMNETINMYKEKKTSALELASQNGTVDSIDQLKSGDSFDAVLRRSKFKSKKDLIASIAVVMVNEVSNALEVALGESESAKLIWRPQTTTALDLEGMEKLMKLIETLEDDDDIQQVFTNIA